MDGEEIVAILKEHTFFKCDTGKCIVTYLSKKIIETDRVICITQEEPLGKYCITVQSRNSIQNQSADSNVRIYTKNLISGSFDIDSLVFDIEKTRFPLYCGGIEKYLDQIKAGSISFVIDSEMFKLQVPSMKLLPLKMEFKK